MKPTYGKRVFREATVPGGASWKCTDCKRELQPGQRVAKSGKITLCPGCISKRNKQ